MKELWMHIDPAWMHSEEPNKGPRGETYKGLCTSLKNYGNVVVQDCDLHMGVVVPMGEPQLIRAKRPLAFVPCIRGETTADMLLCDSIFWLLVLDSDEPPVYSYELFPELCWDQFSDDEREPILYEKRARHQIRINSDGGSWTFRIKAPRERRHLFFVMDHVGGISRLG